VSEVNLKDFLSDLEELKKTNTTSILIPSINKKIDFSLFSVNQHKELLKTAFEGIDGVIKSGIIFNKIIIDNSTKPIDYSLFDKNKILVDLRKASISEKVIIKNTTYDLNDLPESSEMPTLPHIEYKGISVELHVPSLELDKKISEKALIDINKLAEEEKRKESIGILLIYEIVKFVKSLTIKDVTINIDNLSAYESKKLIETLPLKLNNLIIDYITDFKEACDKFVTFSNGTKLEIDAGFLSNE